MFRCTVGAFQDCRCGPRSFLLNGPYRLVLLLIQGEPAARRLGSTEDFRRFRHGFRYFLRRQPIAVDVFGRSFGVTLRSHNAVQTAVFLARRWTDFLTDLHRLLDAALFAHTLAMPDDFGTSSDGEQSGSSVGLVKSRTLARSTSLGGSASRDGGGARARALFLGPLVSLYVVAPEEHCPIDSCRGVLHEHLASQLEITRHVSAVGDAIVGNGSAGGCASQRVWDRPRAIGSQTRGSSLNKANRIRDFPRSVTSALAMSGLTDNVDARGTGCPLQFEVVLRR